MGKTPYCVGGEVALMPRNYHDVTAARRAKLDPQAEADR